jgi:hypothetical protein
MGSGDNDGSTVVENLHPHLKIEGSSPATGIGTEKKLALMGDRSSSTIVEQVPYHLKVRVQVQALSLEHSKLELIMVSSSSTVVDHLTHYLKVEGSNPSTDHRREKNCEKRNS